jgi:hypothetical protein
MSAEQISFDRDVRPLFRESDRDAMSSAFDLWSYADVSEHANAILGALESGSMPCDGPWDAARVETFRQWSAAGKPA